MLQCALAVFGFVPVIAGLMGCINGVAVFNDATAIGRDLDSHGRYLSGLLLAIGLCGWSSIRRIERHGSRLCLLAAIVATGGAARLYAAYVNGFPSIGMMGGLAMELLVTPGIALWCWRIEKLWKENQGEARA